MRLMFQPVRAIAVTLLVALVAACTTPDHVMRGSGDVFDPYEGMNRRIHGLNRGLDRVAFRPASKGYVSIVPEPMVQSFSDFADNLSMPKNMVNALLQGNPKLFGQALTYDRNMFAAKNNLVLARAAQRKYDLPIIPMTQVERAQLLYTIALSAIKQGDVVIGRGLLEDAIDTHPQYFEEAVRALEALNSK